MLLRLFKTSVGTLWKKTAERRVFQIAALAMLTTVAIVPLRSSLAGSDGPPRPLIRHPTLKCRTIPSTDPNLNYLSLDERMELAMGVWGKSIVHPLGPDYFRFERDMHRQEEQSSICGDATRQSHQIRSNNEINWRWR
jgi:hypothetical protein